MFFAPDLHFSASARIRHFLFLAWEYQTTQKKPLMVNAKPKPDSTSSQHHSLRHKQVGPQRVWCHCGKERACVQTVQRIQRWPFFSCSYSPLCRLWTPHLASRASSPRSRAGRTGNASSPSRSGPSSIRNAPESATPKRSCGARPRRTPTGFTREERDSGDIAQRIVI